MSESPGVFPNHGGDGDFDDYHRSVVRPLRPTPQAIPADLRVRYAVPADPDDVDIRRHIDALVGFWRARHEVRDYSRPVYAALLEAHQELLDDSSVRLYDSAWWRDYTPRTEAVLPRRGPDPAPVGPPRAPEPVAGTAPGPGTPPDEKPPDENPPDDTVAIETPPDGRDRTGSEQEDPEPDRDEPDRPWDLIARRHGSEVNLSWKWPAWARTARVTWEGGRSGRTVDRERIRAEGWWSTTLADDLAAVEVEFTVSVSGPGRGPSPDAVVLVPAPDLEVAYTVRPRSRDWHGRTYEITLRTDRPPVNCEVAVAFAATAHLPDQLHDCEQLKTVFLAGEASTLQVAVEKTRGPGWLRCFVVSAEQRVILTDPHTDTLRVRRWPM